MKWLTRCFYIIGIITIASFSYANKEIVSGQEDKKEEQMINEQQKPTIDVKNIPIVCDEHDEAVCEYIEQQHKESRLKLWFYDVGILVVIKLLELKECLDRCTGTLNNWVKKLICPLQKRAKKVKKLLYA